MPLMKFEYERAALDGVNFRMTRPHRPAWRLTPAQAGFSLIELMMTVSIIAALLAIGGPMLSRSMTAARSVQCQTSLRTVSMDFAMFASDGIHSSRGDDNPLRNRFRLATFQESEYGIDEFWAFDGQQEHDLESGVDHDPLRCAEVRGAVRVAQNHACTSSGALNPPQNVSYGFNSRLHRAEVSGPGGFPLPKPVLLTSEILSQPNVPLLWDVDGKEAFSRGVLPQFSAPSLDSKSVYAGDWLWFPSFRHGGFMNIGFVGGHVLTTRTPLEELSVRWAYQPIH